MNALTQTANIEQKNSTGNKMANPNSIVITANQISTIVYSITIYNKSIISLLTLCHKLEPVIKPSAQEKIQLCAFS